VALGRAIVREPAVFLFDEPLSNLDAALRVSMRGELARLHRRLGATMIYVTHDQVEAMTMGSRICIMQGGRVVQVGAPLDIYRRPANTFVAGFLGSPPMNLLRATVATDGAGAGASASVRVGAATVPLGDALAPAARLAAGTEVVFGLRPEDIRQADSGAAHAGSSVRIAAEVTSVEPLGAETLVTLVPRGGDSEMRARLGRDTALRAGETADFALDLRAVHLFDPRTGQALYPDA
jgi:multiple sugar transport system ATP-binding protein